MLGELQPIDVIVGLFCIGLIAFFTGFWFPRELAEEGEGRLPKKFLALLLFAGINVVVFVVLAAAIQLGRNHEEFGRVLDAAGFEWFADILSSGEDEQGGEAVVGGDKIVEVSPLSADMIATAAAVFFGLFGIRRWRRIEAGALRQLHNISLIAEDARRLSVKLQHGAYRIPETQAGGAALALYQLQRRVSLKEADSTERSLVAKWGKLESLLGLWEHHTLWSETLRQVELPSRASIRHAHERRNTLARRINRHVEDVERGEADPTVLANIAELLRREDVSAERILDELRGLNIDRNGRADEPSLRVLLEPLIEYFHEEYDEALAHMSDATAKSVVMSGDEAGERLALLRQQGFSGIGNVKVINLHGAVFITFSVFVALLLVFNGYVHFRQDSVNTSGVMLVTFAGSMTLAVVAGAMVGGLRSLASAETIPWGWYVLAALVMGMLHFVMVFTAAVGREKEHGLGALILGSLLPFCLVLTICLLSRREMRWRRLPEWVADAGAMAMVMAVVGAVLVFLGQRAGIGTLTEDPMAVRMLRIGILMALVGGSIGGLVVHRVRAAALSRIVDDALSDEGDGVSSDRKSRMEAPTAGAEQAFPRHLRPVA